MQTALITLTTDFGTGGSYVAAMKGVILSLNPAATLVDVSHEIAPQNVREAALCLTQVVAYFPRGTIHVVVVDPGVGSDRRLLCVSMHDQVFLAPDNGVLSWVARGAAMVERIELTERRFWRPHVSATFHGRDILAPAAAHLSLGIAPRELGQSVAGWAELAWTAPERFGDELVGEVLAIDRFGNLITNISEHDLRGANLLASRVACCDRVIPRLERAYSDVAPGELLALVGSSSLLEIAARDGSAAALLNCVAGTLVGTLVRVCPSTD